MPRMLKYPQYGGRYFFREDELNEFKKTTGEVNEAIKPQIFPEIVTDVVDGIEIIKVIFEGDDRPYSAFGKYYKRVADEDREMSPGELRKMMISREYEENWENISSKETVEDIDDNVLMKFYDNAVLCGRLPDLGRDKKTLIEKLGIVNGKYLTNAGRMLFSKNKPVTLKMAVFATEHKDTFLDISRVEGNIFDLIDASMGYIVKNIRWSSKLGEDGIHRIEKPEVPVDALREAVINCFAHARYDVNVQHEIDIYADRIEIINPGSFANDFRPEDGNINGTISENESEILECLRKNNNITASEIVEKIGKSLRTVNRIIASLKAKGLIERIGSNKNGYWKVK